VGKRLVAAVSSIAVPFVMWTAFLVFGLSRPGFSLLTRPGSGRITERRRLQVSPAVIGVQSAMGLPLLVAIPPALFLIGHALSGNRP